jgi:hypothetical protein
MSTAFYQLFSDSLPLIVIFSDTVQSPDIDGVLKIYHKKAIKTSRLYYVGY